MILIFVKRFARQDKVNDVFLHETATFFAICVAISFVKVLLYLCTIKKIPWRTCEKKVIHEDFIEKDVSDFSNRERFLTLLERNVKLCFLSLFSSMRFLPCGLAQFESVKHVIAVYPLVKFHSEQFRYVTWRKITRASSQLYFCTLKDVKIGKKSER